jgi:hypothetical protein
MKQFGMLWVSKYADLFVNLYEKYLKRNLKMVDQYIEFTRKKCRREVFTRKTVAIMIVLVKVVRH